MRINEVNSKLVKQIQASFVEIPHIQKPIMAIGARVRPSQQRSHVAAKWISVGAKHLVWTFLLGILIFVLFLSRTLLYARAGNLLARTQQGGFEFPLFGENSTQTLLRYSLYNRAVAVERERIKIVMKTTDYGKIDLKQVLYGSPKRRTRRAVRVRQDRAWLYPFATRAVEAYFPQFVQLAKTWLGDDGDFNPRVMQDLVQTVKGPLDRNAENWGEDVDMSNSGKRYRSCAVVGNSGVLLNGTYGEQIDSHQMVIRLNNAAIYPYRKHVGSKTTLSFVNSNILRSCSANPDCWCQTYGDDVPIILYICQANHLIHATRCMAKHKSPLLVTHSHLDALCAAIVKMYSVTNFMQMTGLPMSRWDKFHHDEYFHYSSGMEAVVLALGICDSVDMFGFGKFENIKHHYHTKQKVELDLHDYAAEYLFYDDLVHNRTVPFLSDSGISTPPVRIFY